MDQTVTLAACAVAMNAGRLTFPEARALVEEVAAAGHDDALGLGAAVAEVAAARSDVGIEVP